MVFEPGNKHINKHYAIITNSKVLIALSQALIKTLFVSVLHPLFWIYDLFAHWQQVPFLMNLHIIKTD